MRKGLVCGMLLLEGGGVGVWKQELVTVCR